MRHFLWILLYAIIGYLAYTHFINKNYFVLNKIKFSGIDEIDTLEALPKKGLYILQLIRNGALGHFSMDLGILKQNTRHPKDFTLYQFERENNTFRISNGFIEFVRYFNSKPYGWFYIENGKVKDKLPFLDKITDSIKVNRKIFVGSENGYFSLTKADYSIEEYSYGNLILKDSSRNFDLLKPGLYKLSGLDVVPISTDPDTFFEQKNGIFFVPPPGFGIIKKINKDRVLGCIDSIFSLREFPDKIMFKKN